MSPTPGDSSYDVVVIGAGIGGLVTASQLASKGARVLVLERYLIPGGSGGSFKRNGCCKSTFKWCYRNYFNWNSNAYCCKCFYRNEAIHFD